TSICRATQSAFATVSAAALSAVPFTRREPRYTGGLARNTSTMGIPNESLSTDRSVRSMATCIMMIESLSTGGSIRKGVTLIAKRSNSRPRRAAFASLIVCEKLAG
ncbi:MAG TPA: hypothetical protein VGC88_04115, partial [Terriglobales bacterium]